MLFETTHGIPNNYQKSITLVGRPLSIFKMLKMRVSTSSRFYVEKTNLEIGYSKELQSALDTAIIEWRKEGIIVHINIKLQIFEWIIPYYHLIIYKTNNRFSIHAQGRFIQFDLEKSSQRTFKFVYKLINEKERYTQKFFRVDDL